jgi:hypothetical protein
MVDWNSTAPVSEDQLQVFSTNLSSEANQLLRSPATFLIARDHAQTLHGLLMRESQSSGLAVNPAQLDFAPHGLDETQPNLNNGRQ